ncbi:hypothetical protein GJAV_G00256150 [Gymnothorax javanicus]|nr:hypothetical protein GJAV_G00256150 [Gymnothorax javanicus]
MNNREIVAMLEECWKIAAAGPLELSNDAKEEFRKCRVSLSAELSSLLQDAAAMKWPFVPEKWQYKQALTQEDKTTLKELISRHLPQLLVFLKASISAGEPLWAVSVVFLVDRFLYWVDTSKSLLKIAEALHKHYPGTPIAPQVVIRQARLSLNTGKLQKAEYILSSLINKSGATGCWVYHADSDRILVQAVSVQIRGQVLQKLGMWTEAAKLIWASLIGLHALPEPDRKGIGTSLGLLANILVSMNDADFQAFITGQHMDLHLLKERSHRLLAAAEAAKMAAVYSQYDPLYVLTNVVIQGTSLLAYSFLPGCEGEERQVILTEAKEAFEIGLLSKREGEVVTSKQELHSLIKAAYSLTVTHKWLGSSKSLVHEATEECQKAMKELHAYSAEGSGEKDVLSVEIMNLVGRVKEVLGVKPYIKSDERSFVPDSYRSAEETPARFSVDLFSTVMAGFQKHHASVCQAGRMPCKSMAISGGGQSCAGACVTAMKTATVALGTEGATKDLTVFTDDRGPQWQRRDRKTKGGHVDQLCSSELRDGEEVNCTPKIEACGFEEMSKMRSNSRSLRNPPVDAKARSKGRDVMTCTSRKAEKRVNQKCLTEVSDEEDGKNVSREDPESLARCDGGSVGAYRQRPHASASESSPLPSSWESISCSVSGKDKDPVSCSKPGVERWVDQQCPTECSDEEVDGKASAIVGFKGMCRANTSSKSETDGTPSFTDSRVERNGKDSVSAVHDKRRVAKRVDQQCPTEFSDEEEDGETNGGGGGFIGMDKARAASGSLNDSMDSNSSWQKVCPSDLESRVGRAKNIRKSSDTHTEDEWVNLDCPAEVEHQEELGDVGRPCSKDASIRGSDIISLDDSLGSNSSWQKLSFSDGGSLPRNGEGAGTPVKPGASVRVDPNCPTYGSDEEDHRDTGRLPVQKIKPDDPVKGFQAHPKGPRSLAPNSGPGKKSSLEEDMSLVLVEYPDTMHGKKANGPKGAPAHDMALRSDYHVPGPRHVDPKAETEDYILGDFSLTADYDEPSAFPAGIGSMGHCAEPKSFRIVGNVEGHEKGFEKLCLDDYRHLSNNDQSHDQCLGKCIPGSNFSQRSTDLTEQDYKALMSGVCHKCLLKRLDIKKTFKLRKYRTAHNALLLKYSKVSDRWTARETKVYIGDLIGKEGCQRTAFWIQILHQEEILGSYVGKTYRSDKEIRYHLTDVERQMTAQYYVTEFNKRLYEKSIPAQIFFIPSEVLLILEGDVITNCVTVEPYMLGDFVKLTNNTVYTNQKYEATDYGIAFGHFTYVLSGCTEVVVDLQGWVTDDGKGLTYLTDPQIHSVREGGSRVRQGERGIKYFLETSVAAKKGDDEDWVHLPNKCEVCKFVSIEMKSAFEETGKTKEVIDTNYRFLDSKGAPPIKYVKSDIRFIEVIENVCKRLMEYNLHKERTGSNRFAKGMSETFSTLHGLVNKGVKVVMDIPYELWNETSAEVADLKKQCDVMVEQYEEVIEDWYKGNQEEDLTTYLCEKHVLKGQDTDCLKEKWEGKKGDVAAIGEEKKKKKKKGKKGKGKESQSTGQDTHGKKKDKKTKKKKKGKKVEEEVPRERRDDDGHTSEEDIQEKVPLPNKNTEL